MPNHVIIFFSGSNMAEAIIPILVSEKGDIKFIRRIDYRVLFGQLVI